ncbi:retrovirus-related pol polyprotein from transposon TNT 1-94 [Tanacetum coccineum]
MFYLPLLMNAGRPNCTVKFGNDHVAKVLGYGDYQIGNVTISRVYYVEGKSKKKPHKPKSEDTNQEKLYLLHMDFCGPLRVASINGKTSKDEAPDFIIKFLKMIQVRLKVPVRRIRTDNGTEFVNQTLREYYEKVGISHETFVARSPQQNGVVERRNPPEVVASIHEVVAPAPAASTSLPSSTNVDQDAPSPIAHMGNDLYFGIPILEVPSDQSSSMDSIHIIVHPDHQISKHTLVCYYDAFLTAVEPKTYKYALTQSCWIDVMQEELNEFKRLGVWELVPRPDKVMVITLKWIYKVKLDELGDNPNHVYKLKKALYGLKQAPRVWEGKELLLVQTYIDDIIFAASTPELCDLFAKIMCSKFKMSMMGKISFFLGLQISQNPRGIFINQSKYALKSLKKYGFNSCDPVDTPMVEKSKLDEDKEGKAVDPSHYRGMIGTLLYLIATYADTDHAGCQDTRRSTSGSMQFLGDRLVSWSSKRQKSVAISSTKAEYIAMSKHIDIRFHFIKEHVENGAIERYFVNTEYQLADIFTKPLARERIEFLINKLGALFQSHGGRDISSLKVEAMPKSAWTEKDQIDKFLIERRLMRSLEMSNLVDPHGFEGYLKIEVKCRSIKVNEFQRSFHHSDAKCLSRSDEVLKLKNLKRDAL